MILNIILIYLSDKTETIITSGDMNNSSGSTIPSGGMNILLGSIIPSSGKKGGKKSGEGKSMAQYKEELQKLAIRIGEEGGEKALSRGSRHFTRIFILAALLDYLEGRYKYSKKFMEILYKRTLQKMYEGKNIHIDGIKLLISSYLNESYFGMKKQSIEEDETFKKLAAAYRYIDYKRKVKRALTGWGCFKNYANRFPVDPRNRFLYSDISIKEKYKRLFKELKDTIIKRCPSETDTDTKRYPSKKDHDYICMIVECREESGKYILRA